MSAVPIFIRGPGEHISKIQVEFDEPERLLRDVHPADLLLADGKVITGARVFVTSHRLLVFGETAGRRIEQLHSFDLAQPASVQANRGTLTGRLQAVLADESTVWINPGRGCGCSSPLKALGAPVSWTGR